MKRKTIPFAKLQRLSFVNSKKLPQRIVHDGVVKEWVGIGWIELKDEEPKPSDVYVVGG